MGINNDDDFFRASKMSGYRYFDNVVDAVKRRVSLAHLFLDVRSESSRTNISDPGAADILFRLKCRQTRDTLFVRAACQFTELAKNYIKKHNPNLPTSFDVYDDIVMTQTAALLAMGTHGSVDDLVPAQAQCLYMDAWQKLKPLFTAWPYVTIEELQPEMFYLLIAFILQRNKIMTYHLSYALLRHPDFSKYERLLRFPRMIKDLALHGYSTAEFFIQLVHEMFHPNMYKYTI